MRYFLLVFLLLASGAASAQDDVVIYRCTDASGALTVQNDTPCPRGSRQEKRVIQDVPVGPAPRPAPAPAEPPAATSPTRAPSLPTVTRADARADGAPALSAQADDIERLPPPVLFECRTYDNGRYLSDSGIATERCMALATSSLDGRPSDVATACEMVTDQCQRVTDEALCDGWRQRLGEAESALRFGLAGTRDAAQAEVERIGRIVRESTCGR